MNTATQRPCHICRKPLSSLSYWTEGDFVCPDCFYERSRQYAESQNKPEPSDDDEPIDRGWAQFRFTEDAAIEVGDGEVRLSVNDGGQVYWGTTLPHIKTRGDLRRLLAALGYKE